MTSGSTSVHRHASVKTTFGEDQSRLVWMDFARGICILLVIVFHARPAMQVYAPMSLTEPFLLDTFNRFFAPYRMPLLMFLSGMLLHKSLAKDTRHYVQGKFTQIFWPFLIFSMLILFVGDRLTLINMLKVPISSPTLLWYLWFLVAFYLLTLAFVKARVPLWAVAVASLALVPFLPDIQRIPRFAFLFFFFLAGHLAMTMMHRSARGTLQLGPLPLGRLTGAIGLVLTVIGGYISVTGGSIKYDVLHVWAPLGLAVLMLTVGPLYRTTSATAWLEWIGRNSLVFYVIHFPVQMVTAQFMYGSSGITEFMPIFLSVVMMSLLVSTLLQMARTRFWFVAALFDFNRLRAGRPGLNPG